MNARALVRNSSKDNLELDDQAYGYSDGRVSSFLIVAARYQKPRRSVVQDLLSTVVVGSRSSDAMLWLCSHS